MDKKRYAHSLRVEETAVSLAKHYGVDQKKTRLAALLHDLGRVLDHTLSHSVLSAKMAREQFGVKDKEVLSAITKHTLGGKNMSLLEKIIYIADHAEPKRSHPEAAQIRALAYLDLDAAVCEAAGAAIKHLINTKQKIHTLTVETRNTYLK
ncbi:MAG: bis(5'-nucleosyl)-tetraphosphatase (symmetrical) YqeK [Candidatus Saganbacteria bacterium]|nr:bis(5'-nucleosyl)-tetraphosphatase (symmetrical) YqeK [Candidatus Saganbacteria bacterium]